ncbi:hypothetical protein GF402_03315 [Candidatus Fermentibacteria bacterium]|nr:hypothetical protein [Candidatus Fermentibacteria bacterium]
MFHLMVPISLLILTAVGAEEPPELYALEYPGLVFAALPPELAEPVEGSLTEEVGAIASPPTDNGVEFHLKYWKLQSNPGFNPGLWLREKFDSELSLPDGHEVLLGKVEYVQGSMETGYLEERSLGLVCLMNFTITSEEDWLEGGGAAAGIFRNGYCTLLYSMAPEEELNYAKNSVRSLIDYMYLAE